MERIEQQKVFRMAMNQLRTMDATQARQRMVEYLRLMLEIGPWKDGRTTELDKSEVQYLLALASLAAQEG